MGGIRAVAFTVVGGSVLRSPLICGNWKSVLDWCVCLQAQWGWRCHLPRPSLSMAGASCVLTPSLCPLVEWLLHPGCWVGEAVTSPWGRSRALVLACWAVGHLIPAGSSSYRGRQPSVSPRTPLPPPQGSSLGPDLECFQGFWVTASSRAPGPFTRPPKLLTPKPTWGPKSVSH